MAKQKKFDAGDFVSPGPLFDKPLGKEIKRSEHEHETSVDSESATNNIEAGEKPTSAWEDLGGGGKHKNRKGE